MNEKFRLKLPPLNQRKWLAYIVTLFLLFATLFGWRHWENSQEEKLQNDFKRQTDRVAQLITSGLDYYRMVITGGAGLFAASGSVERAEWKAYYDYREMENHFPGAQGFGFSKVLRPWEVARHTQAVRSEGFPDYSIRPAGEREIYTSIIYLEPFDERNRRAFGYDMFSEPVRRKAMSLARDTAKPAMSGKVRLVQEDGRAEQAGFLMYLPVYANGMPLRNSEERAAALTGYVYCPFRINDLIRHIYPAVEENIDLEIFDGTEMSPSTKMYDSYSTHDPSNKAETPSDKLFSSQKTIDLYNHQWTLLFNTPPPPGYYTNKIISYSVLILGVLFCFLVLAFYLSIENTGMRAFSLAREMTSALEESERKYRALNDTLPLGAAIIGPGFEIIAANATKLKWFPGSLEGRHHTCFAAFNDPPGTEVCEGCPVAKTFQDGKVHKGERVVNTARGMLNLSITSAPITDKEGRVISVHETVEDITERKLAEEKLRRYQENLEELVDVRTSELRKFRWIIEQTPVSVIITDKNAAIEYVNNKFTEASGYGSDEIIGKKPGIFWTGNDPADFHRNIVKTLASGTAWRGELQSRRKDGGVYWESANISPVLNEAGEITHYVAVNEDITERKRVSEALTRAKMAAEEANLAKSTFVANMSHEIRTPMNAILGFAQLLERDPLLAPKHLEYLKIITRSGEHLLRLINDILDISKIEAGKMTLAEAPFNLFDLFEELRATFKERAEAKGLQFLFESIEVELSNVSGDEGKLRQALINLVGNAIKFTSEGGISVRARLSPVGDESGDFKERGLLTVEIEDTGPGIKQEDLAKIFDPFQQTETGTKLGGTGLGLAISRKFVELMGGELTVASEEGKGSCFTLQIPLEPADAYVKEKSEHNRIVGLEPGAEPARILVVDDLPDNRMLLREMLSPLHFEIKEASNGVEALELFAQWVPHLVLMDMRMPLMDGYEATTRLRATEAGRTTPIVALTASAFRDAKEKVFSVGVDGYLRKPFQHSELLAVLGKFLNLRYIYADESGNGTDKSGGSPPEVEKIAAIPGELISAMRKAVVEGDVELLMEIIEQLEKVDAPSAQKFRLLANRFDYAAINGLLEKNEGPNG